jgi:hypothetical protein
MVSFTVTRGGGAIEHESRATDVDGRASPGWWRMGDTVGANVITARLANGAARSFTVTSTPSGGARVIAAFSLVSIGGKALPQTFSGAGTSWTITGGHYYLAEDGTYEFAYELNGDRQPPPAISCWGSQYTGDASGSGLRFFLRPGSYPASAFYQARGGLFSTGTLIDRVMKVTYEDFLDFEDEVYELQTGTIR